MTSRAHQGDSYVDELDSGGMLSSIFPDSSLHFHDACNHGTYYGVDICDSLHNDFKIRMEFDKANRNHSVSTPVVGGRDFWLVTDNNVLHRVHCGHRIKLPLVGVATFLRSSCMINIHQY